MMLVNKFRSAAWFYAIALSVITLSVQAVDTDEADDVPEDPLAELGVNSWFRFKPRWALSVNDQCVYEFVFEFEHDETLPMGTAGFEGVCGFNSITEAEDGLPFLQDRRHWEKFPDYVWETIGFNHMSLDWQPCGHLPKGYALPQYDFSFFRVTPEFRAEVMQCEILPENRIINPVDKLCDTNQDSTEGRNFFIVPGALINRIPVVNTPTSFTAAERGAAPTLGLRMYDASIVPEFPGQWNDLVLYMSTYDGDLVMWQVHAPYKLLSENAPPRFDFVDGDNFHSASARYHETTIGTIPDTFATDYDKTDDVIRFIMVGKSGLCRNDFEQAQNAAGGPPTFPKYDELENLNPGETDGNPSNPPGNNGGSGGVMAGDSQFTFSLAVLLCVMHFVRW